MKKAKSRLRRAQALLASRRFGWLVLGLLVAQAAWIALSGKYPMAFDEDFHLGIIKLYAHHISPFWSHQPESADMFGAVARDPSYLYQYLMSFPYRFIMLFTHNQSAVVIILRFINIGFFAGGLVLFRKLLLKTGFSRALVGLSLLAFVLLPIVPLLAAQINYDNLLLPLVALALLLTLKVDDILRTEKRLPTGLLLGLLILCLLASLVKYAFLPIFIAVVGFLLMRYWQQRHSVELASLVTCWKGLKLGTRLLLITGLIISAGLFYERIGVNLIRYHSPVPDCSKVLSVEDCADYGPWIRDYNFKLNKVSNAHSPLIFTADWFYGMWLRTFFAVAGPNTNNFETRGPLIPPSIVSIAAGLAGVVAFAFSAKRLFKRYDAHVIWLFLATAGSYIGFLWVDEYLAWVRTGQPVAINGRYLLPILLLLFVLIAEALYELTKTKPRLQLSLAAIVVFCMLWGGGALTFILRSGDSWYWNSPVVRSVNSAVRQTLGPITPGYRDSILFL